MLIKISSLDVKYGYKTVLKDMNLTLDAGEIVTIVGPNGSGKTTLFKAIIGAIPISKGKIYTKPNLRIGYVPQQLKIDQTLPITVERFLKLAHKNCNRSLDKIEALLGSKDLLNIQVNNLSGGQMQRVLLARALINNPEILLLDEATRGLDQPGVASFYRKIENIRNSTNCAILMISHDLHVVMSSSDRVICVNGHICCEGAPESVATSPEYKALFGSDVDGTFALYRHHHDHKHDSKIER
tara:strand:- start:1134 stop:1856 length:723 start_codon:yes stop_codon:yes gene_type:complete